MEDKEVKMIKVKVKEDVVIGWKQFFAGQVIEVNEEVWEKMKDKFEILEQEEE